jgi:hypothetical protein
MKADPLEINVENNWDVPRQEGAFRIYKSIKDTTQI